MRFLILGLILFCTFSVSAQKLKKDNVYFKVWEAAKQSKNKEVAGIKTLYKLSLEDHKDEMLNKLLIKVTVLAMIQSNSRAISSYIPAVDSKFIALEPLAFLGQAPFQNNCFKCRGEGTIQSRCKLCIKGVCKNCKGQKEIMYKGLGGKIEVKKCEICKRSGKCITCDGKGTEHKTCHICVGKGTLFSAKAIPVEYKKTIDYIIEFMPKYAAGKNIFINDEMLTLAKEDKLKKEIEAARKEAKRQKAAELALIEEQRKKAMQKRLEVEAKRDEALIAAFGGGAKKHISKADDNLQHVLLEFNQFFRNRERIQKQSIYVSAEAEYQVSKPTLIIEVTASIAGMSKDLKLQYLEAFYSFFKLRCVSNGLGKNVNYIANYRKRQIAANKGDEVVLK